MVIVACPHCGAQANVLPPHGDDPCSQLLRLNAARLAVLEAQRDYYAALAEAVREPATEIPWPQRDEAERPPF